MFGKWSGTEVKIDGIEYLIMKESDVMGVLTETEAKQPALSLPLDEKEPALHATRASNGAGAKHTHASTFIYFKVNAPTDGTEAAQNS